MSVLPSLEAQVARIWLQRLASIVALAMSLAPLALARPARPAQDDKTAIRELLEAQTAAWNRGDTAAFMEGYWRSEKTEFVGSGGILRGWTTVLERYRRDYPDTKAMGQLSFGNLEIKLLSDDAAYVLGEFHLQREKDNPSGVFTLIMRKFPEGWRIVHDHTTAYSTVPQHP